MRTLFLLFFSLNTLFSFAQNKNNSPMNEPEAAEILQKLSAKYKVYKTVSAAFTLTVIRPKLKPDEPDSKYTDTQDGEITLKGSKFRITVKGQELICDGKNIWTYSEADKEVQVNLYEESDEAFSPSKIFTLYKEGYGYQIKEKKVFNGKNATVIEMSPANKKLSFFKIDVAVDDATNTVVESKVYEKSGVRYIYHINKLKTEVTQPDTYFTFDPKQYPKVKVVDIR